MPRPEGSCWAEPHRGEAARRASNGREPARRSGAGRVSIGLVLSGLIMAATVLPAAAEAPSALVGDLAADGVYIAPERTDLEEGPLVAAVNEARAGGVELVVVAPLDPEPDPRAFARRVQEATDVDAAMIFTDDGQIAAYATDDLKNGNTRALAAAAAAPDPAAAVTAYETELLTEPSGGFLGVVITVVVLIGVLVAALVAAVILEQRLRQARLTSA
ncbi:MAG: DUF6676 family protein [Acidimicrobiales bacterium]